MRTKIPVLYLMFAALLSGCAGQSGVQTQGRFSDSERIQKYAEEDRQFAQENETKRQAAREIEIAQLRSEYATLKETASKNEQQAAHLLRLLQLNDSLVEHKEEFIGQFQQDLEKRKGALFEAMGKTGELRAFQVEDVFEYKGYLGITMLFLWPSSDTSALVGRGFLALDPDKNYDVSDCEMLGQRPLTAEEYASFSGNEATQLEQEAPPIAKRPDPESFKMTSETKNHLVEGMAGAGFSILSAYLIHAINSDN